MSLLYRENRETYTDSIGTTKEYLNDLEMKCELVNRWNQMFGSNVLSLSSISIEENPIKPYLKKVCVSKLGEIDYIKENGFAQCIGYCIEVSN